MSNPALRPYLWMLLGSFAFSWMGTLAHHVGSAENHGVEWQVVAIFRAIVPLVLVGGWALAAGVSLVFWKPAILWMRSLAGSCSLIGTFYAITRLPVSDVFTLSNMFPVWVALLAWPMLGTFPSAKVWLSVGCGAAGVVLIQRPHLAEGNFAAIIALSVSIFTAFALIGLHRLRDLDTRAVVVHFSATSLAFAVVAYFVFPSEAGDFDLEARANALMRLAFDLKSWQWADLIGLGVCASIGQICLTKAYTVGDPSKISVVGLTQIVFALLLDTVVLGHWDQLDPTKLIGIPLVLGPTAWLMLRHQSPPADGFSDEPLETTPNISE